MAQQLLREFSMDAHIWNNLFKAVPFEPVDFFIVGSPADILDPSLSGVIGGKDELYPVYRVNLM